MSADTDVEKAVAVKWDTTGGLGGTVELYSGRLAPEIQPDIPYKMPYCMMQSGKAKDYEYMSSGSYIDYRLVTFSVYCVGKVECGGILQLVMDTYNSTTLSLVIDNASFAQSYLVEDSIVIDPKQKDGEDVWVGKAIFEIMSTRDS